eukprot:Awhi_evm1s1649
MKVIFLNCLVLTSFVTDLLVVESAAIESRGVCVKRDAATGRCMQWVGQSEIVDATVDDNTEGIDR